MKVGEETFTTEKMRGGNVKGTAKVEKCGCVHSPPTYQKWFGELRGSIVNKMASDFMEFTKKWVGTGIK